MAGAFPPLAQTWLLWPAWLLLWRIGEGHRPYKPLYWGLFLWNLLTCYWLTLTALSAPSPTEALVSFLAGALAILVNPLLMLLPWWGARSLGQKLGSPTPVWLFIFLWGVFEVFHFRWELSWGWLTLGWAWSAWEIGRNLASVFGPIGLSVWTLIGIALWRELGTSRGKWGAIGLWFLLTLGMGLFPPSFSGRSGMPRSVWAMQPNIDPYAKFAEFSPEKQVERLLGLLPLAPPPGSLIVGPETVIPLPVSIDHPRTEPFLRPFFAYAERYRVNVLLGVVGYKYFSPGMPLPASARPMPEGGGYEMYNAALLIRPDTFQVHIKDRLVPFVERVPYLEVFSFLKGWYIDLGGGFGSFGRPVTQGPLFLYPDNLPVAVAVCYESIFVEDMRRRLPEAPSLIAILTNDGWWKKSSGYQQHYTYGRLTAAALGVPAVRGANTGISALLTAEGDPIASMPYDQLGRIHAHLTPQMPTSFYYRFGGGVLGGLLTFVLILWGIQWWRSRRSSA